MLPPRYTPLIGIHKETDMIVTLHLCRSADKWDAFLMVCLPWSPVFSC